MASFQTVVSTGDPIDSKITIYAVKSFESRITRDYEIKRGKCSKKTAEYLDATKEILLTSSG